MSYTLYEINIFVNAESSHCGLIRNTFSMKYLLLHKTSTIKKYHDMILKVFEKKCPTTNEDLKNKVNA